MVVRLGRESSGADSDMQPVFLFLHFLSLTHFGFLSLAHQFHFFKNVLYSFEFHTEYMILEGSVWLIFHGPVNLEQI